jgi:hypothetical protein
MFLEKQGYALKENIYYQDNQSAMEMELNGRRSAGQKSLHVDIRFFFIKDRITSEGLTIKYCPTKCMLADYYTKPLQGSLFRKLRAGKGFGLKASIGLVGPVFSTKVKVI